MPGPNGPNSTGPATPKPPSGPVTPPPPSPGKFTGRTWTGYGHIHTVPTRRVRGTHLGPGDWLALADIALGVVGI